MEDVGPLVGLRGHVLDEALDEAPAEAA
jgi:hypothetical protein